MRIEEQWYYDTHIDKNPLQQWYKDTYDFLERKVEKPPMYYYNVSFCGSNKPYLYKSKINLPRDQYFYIIVDGRTTYDNPIIVKNKFTSAPNVTFTIREITEICFADNANQHLTKRNGALSFETRRPDDTIKEVYFNKEKGATCVLWKDGTKTVIHCAPLDSWDEEKALALCYMKKALGNRGSFNETLKKYCHNSEGA